MKNILPSLWATRDVLPPCLAPDVEGFTSPKMRLMLNRLVQELPRDEIYFEIGSHKGATLISALLDHRTAIAHACDNWSEFKERDARACFFENLRRYQPRLPEIVVHEEDCFKLAEREALRGPIGIYFYDGDHSRESQRRAITAYAPSFASEVIVLVDDWNWEPARAGTAEALAQLKPKESYFVEFKAGHNGDIHNFWNGVGAFHLRLR